MSFAQAPASASAATFNDGNDAGDDGMTPLDVMLASMRWAHGAAEATCAHMTELAGDGAVLAAKAALALRAFAVKTAKAAAPYMHARLRAADAPDPNGIKTHEEWLADMERAEAETERRRAAQRDGAADARPLDAAPAANAAPAAPSAGPSATPSPEPQPGAVSVEQRAVQAAGQERAAARTDARASPAPPRRYRMKRTTVSPWAL